MTFKELEVGDMFEFDHSMLSSWSGATGPWTKRTARTYMSVSDQRTASGYVPFHRVGTINVEVIPVIRSTK
jgi:hypothetical protein